MTNLNSQNTTNRFLALVRQVLWEEWDPIGVKSFGGPEDEYDSYAPNIADLLLAGATSLEIAAQLEKVEKTAMGLSLTAESRAHASSVAESLIRLRDADMPS